jgi:hypothetical protein
MEDVPQFQADWNRTKSKLKQMFSSLADEDVLLEEGKQLDLLKRLQARLGKTQSELCTLISELEPRAPASSANEPSSNPKL